MSSLSLLPNSRRKKWNGRGSAPHSKKARSDQTSSISSENSADADHQNIRTYNFDCMESKNVNIKGLCFLIALLCFLISLGIYQTYREKDWTKLDFTGDWISTDGNALRFSEDRITWICQDNILECKYLRQSDNNPLEEEGYSSQDYYFMEVENVDPDMPDGDYGLMKFSYKTHELYFDGSVYKYDMRHKASSIEAKVLAKQNAWRQEYVNDANKFLKQNKWIVGSWKLERDSYVEYLRIDKDGRIMTFDNDYNTLEDHGILSHDSYDGETDCIAYYLEDDMMFIGLSHFKKVLTTVPNYMDKSVIEYQKLGKNGDEFDKAWKEYQERETKKAIEKARQEEEYKKTRFNKELAGKVYRHEEGFEYVDFAFYKDMTGEVSYRVEEFPFTRLLHQQSFVWEANYDVITVRYSDGDKDTFNVKQNGLGDIVLVDKVGNDIYKRVK